MNEYVSVVLATYNRAHMLVDAMKSVLDQTYPYLELIVIDDASEDDTEAVVATIEDERLRYIRLEENKGPAGARNVGIMNAKYDYIAFHDSDDFWMPEKLERQMPLFSKGYGLVYCAFQYYKGGTYIREPNLYMKEEQLSGHIFDSLWEANKIDTPTMVVKKECLDEVGSFTEQLRSLEDWELALRISEKYEIGYIDEVLLQSSYSETGVNHNYAEKINTLLYIIEEFKDRNLKYTGMWRRIFNFLQFVPVEQWNENWKKIIWEKFAGSEDIVDWLIRQEKVKMRYMRYNEILERLCYKEKFEKFVGANIIEKKEKIAVYGMGYLGKALLNRFAETNIEVDCVIDKMQKVYRDYYTIHINDLGKRNIDVVFITVPDEFNNIARELKAHAEVKCIDIKRILEA